MIRRFFLVLLWCLPVVAFAAAGAGDIALTTPDASSTSIPSICLSGSFFDRKAQHAIVLYESCNTATNPPTFTGNAYAVDVTATGFTMRPPFGAATTGTSVTWTQVVSDFGTLPGEAKVFMKRFKAGS